MARKREQRLRKRLRAAERELELIRPVAKVAESFELARTNPDLKTPGHVDNWLNWLVFTVRQMRDRRAA